MFTRSHSLKGIASLGSTAIAIMLLSSCSGAGFGPTESRGTTPDLVVAAPSVSDSGPVAGMQFTMWTTVRNVGDGAAAATRLRYYRSTDATITAADTEVGTVAVTGLADSNSTRESVDLTAPSAAGTYYYGACVDAVTDESDITNNCSSSVRVTAREPEPGEPDLVVAAPSVSDSSPTAGASFTLSATVRNAGDGASAATTLRYYRSPDATITTSDTEVGTDEVAALAASGSSSESVDVTASATAGTYYYGACVDAVADESDTTNNCSSSVRVTVREPEPGGPDLVVVAPSVSDSGPTAGATFTLSATVRNAGDGASAATTLRYYRSPDATITTSDTEVGTDEVATLAASGSSSESVDVTAPATAGTYYYGACVDAVTDESDITNNCSSSVPVTVSEPVVAAPTVSDSVPAPGATFTLSVSVESAGDGAAATTTLSIYRSTDATITTSDTLVGTVVAELATTETSSRPTRLAAAASPGTYYVGEVELTAPDTPGTYYYGACVDTMTGGADITNNCSSSVPVTVSEPDLVVAATSVGDSSPTAGATFTLSATVRNDGEGASAATTLRYYRSTDATITTSDTAVGTDEVAGLAASGSSRQSVILVAPATAGTYYYGACVDSVTGESDITNNCSSSVQVTVPEPEKPDLKIYAVVAGTNPFGGTGPGGLIQLSVGLRNDGDAAAAATTLRFYRSTDATITTADTEEGTVEVEELAASGTTSEGMDVNAPATTGTYYYGACVDAVPDESDTTNNCSPSVRVTVTEPAPDLVVAAPTVDDSGPAAGESFTLSATVKNDGEGAAAATTLRYYRSTDATIATSDTQVGTDAVAGLAAAGSSSQSVDLTAPDTSGTYYYGACVDAVTDESDTTNNCSSSVTVTVPEPDKPDLVVESPSVDDSGPAAGESFTLSATVKNDGEGAAAATTLRYYRSTDATIATSDTQVGTDAVAGLAAAGSSSQSVDLTAPDTSGTYYYGACVDAVTDESDTTNNCSSSVTVTVPEPDKPDLVVESPSVDDSGPAAGESFTLSATVKNDGEGAAAATTLRYYRSTDATIATSDTQVGTDAVAGLAAAGSSSQSVDLTAPDTSGTYYYGACVDAVTDESDTTNNCSSSVTVTVPEPDKPDLVVESPSVDDSGPAAGESFTLSATVKNDGEGAAAATTLRYYRSTDATIATSDTQVGTDAVAGLGAAGSSSQSVDLTAPDTSGTYYYGACVDTVTDESDTTNNCSNSVVVTIPEAEQQAPSVEISAEDDKTWVPVGDTVNLSARVLDEEGEEVTGATVTWSSSNIAVATVNSFGVMTAVGEGTVTLTATATVSAEQTVSGFIRVTVVKHPARIEMAPDSLSFDTVGDIKILTATVYDADDNVMHPNSFGLRWATANEEVATVSYRPSAGVQASVHSVGEGTTTITLYVSGSATGTATVTVTLPTARVTVEPASLFFKALGVTKTVTVRVLDENGVVVEGASFYFANAIYHPCCGEELVGPIALKMLDDGMELTSKGPGTGKLTIGSEGAESAILLVYVYQEPASLTISPDSASLTVDETTTLRASVMDANGHDIRVAERGKGGLVVYWETSDSEVATVDGAYATATVTAVAAGMATITGRVGGTAITGTATITVTESN